MLEIAESMCEYQTVQKIEIVAGHPTVAPFQLVCFLCPIIRTPGGVPVCK